MTVNSSIDEPEDGGRRELTPEEREKLRRLAQSLRGVSMPKFDLKIPTIVDTSAFAKVAADAAKFSSFALAVQGTSKKQFDFINSDFFKTHTATQAQFAKLSANLTKTINFDVSASVAKIVQQFAAQQSSWLKTLSRRLNG